MLTQVKGKMLKVRLLISRMPKCVLCADVRASVPPWWLWSIRTDLERAMSVLPPKYLTRKPPQMSEAVPMTAKIG